MDGYESISSCSVQDNRVCNKCMYVHAIKEFHENNRRYPGANGSPGSNNWSPMKFLTMHFCTYRVH